jgi:hypothetical protein
MNGAENMHHFVADMTQLELGAVRAFVSRAEEIYDRELSAYVTFVLRRPMAKIIVRPSLLHPILDFADLTNLAGLL